MDEQFYTVDNGYGLIAVFDSTDEKVDEFIYSRRRNGKVSLYREAFGAVAGTVDNIDDLDAYAIQLAYEKEHISS